MILDHIGKAIVSLGAGERSVQEQGPTGRRIVDTPHARTLGRSQDVGPMDAAQIINEADRLIIDAVDIGIRRVQSVERIVQIDAPRIDIVAEDIDQDRFAGGRGGLIGSGDRRQVRRIVKQLADYLKALSRTTWLLSAALRKKFSGGSSSLSSRKSTPLVPCSMEFKTGVSSCPTSAR